MIVKYGILTAIFLIFSFNAMAMEGHIGVIVCAPSYSENGFVGYNCGNGTEIYDGLRDYNQITIMDTGQ